MANPFAGRDAHSAEYFGDVRDHWWNQDYLRFLSERWGGQAVTSVLDVGCGVGHWGRLLARTAFPLATVSGIDREAQWVAHARAHGAADGNAGRFRYQRAVAEALPFQSGTFDVVTCQTVLMHVRDPARVLREMARVARPGGLLLVAEPTNVMGPALEHALAMPALPVDDTAALVRFQLLCQRGKALLGEGNDLIGEAIPALLAALPLHGIEVRLNDRVSPLVSPYTTPFARALTEELHDTVARDVWVWSRALTRRYYLAAGGAESEFDRLWAIAIEQRRRAADAVAAGQYAGAGGGLLYLAWGRTAA